MTLSDILSDCYARLGYSSTPDSGVTARLTRFANETQRELCSDPILQQWLIGTQTFDTVADQTHYGLPPIVARVLKIFSSDHRYTLREMSLSDYREIQPDPTASTGIPTHFVQFGGSDASIQLASPSTLYALSTSASDTNTAYLEGVRTGGYAFADSVTMTGLTAAPFAYSDIEEVTKFYLSAPAVGTVTLQDTP